MKCSSGIFGFLLFVSGNLYAQSDWSLEIQGGIGNRYMHGNKLTRQASVLSLSGGTGIMAHLPVLPAWNLKTGLSFELKGSRSRTELPDLNGAPSGTSTNFYLNLYYLTIPLLMEYQHPGYPFYLEAGGFAGVPIKTTAENLVLSQSLDGVNRTDWGIILGAGYFHHFKKGLSLRMGLRNSLGIQNISEARVYNDRSLRTGLMVLQLGLVKRIPVSTK